MHKVNAAHHPAAWLGPRENRFPARGRTYATAWAAWLPKGCRAAQGGVGPTALRPLPPLRQDCLRLASTSRRCSSSSHLCPRQGTCACSKLAGAALRRSRGCFSRLDSPQRLSCLCRRASPSLTARRMRQLGRSHRRLARGGVASGHRPLRRSRRQHGCLEGRQLRRCGRGDWPDAERVGAGLHAARPAGRAGLAAAAQLERQCPGRFAAAQLAAALQLWRPGQR